MHDGVRIDHRVVQTTAAHAITVAYFPPVWPHLALDVLDYFPVGDEQRSVCGGTFLFKLCKHPIDELLVNMLMRR